MKELKRVSERSLWVAAGLKNQCASPLAHVQVIVLSAAGRSVPPSPSQPEMVLAIDLGRSCVLSNVLSISIPSPASRSRAPARVRYSVIPAATSMPLCGLACCRMYA